MLKNVDNLEKKRRIQPRRKVFLIFLILGLAIFSFVILNSWMNKSGLTSDEELDFSDDFDLEETGEITISDISDRESINDLRKIDLDRVERGGFLLSYIALEKELIIESSKKDTELQIQLTSDHTTTGLIVGSDVKVADFLLIDWGNTRKVLIDGMSYFNAKGDFKQINREVWFKYGTEEEVCEENDLSNGSSIQPNCYNSITWTRFNTLDELPHKNIKVSMWTNTNPGESVEWIPTINGFDILQWAAWNISDAVYDGYNNFTAPITSPDAFTFGDSGSKAYVAGAWTEDIVQYDCSVAYNLSTCVNSNKNKSTGSGTLGLDFSSDGGAFYKINSGSGGTMAQWNMSTQWDVSTATETWNSGGMGGVNGSVGIRMSSLGDHLYTTDVGATTVTLWDCATAWNLSSCDPIDKFTATGTPRSAFFNMDGNVSYIIDSITDKVHQFNCSTAWDATSCIDALPEIDISTPHSEPRDIYFETNGSAFYIVGQGLHVVTKWVIDITEDAPTTSVTVTLNTPTNGEKATDVIDFNATLVGTNLNITNATLYIWNSTGEFLTNYTNLGGASNRSEVNWTLSDFVLGQEYHWNVLAGGNNTEVYWATSNYSFTSSVFTETTTTYPNSVLETSTQTFSQQINTISSVTSASVSLIYNGTAYPIVVDDLSSNNYAGTRTIDISLSPVDSNKTFYWDWSFTTAIISHRQNSTIFSHEVNRTNLVNCASGNSNQTINFTIYNATNPFPLVNATFKIALDHWLGLGTTSRGYSYEDVTETESNFSFCISHDETFYTDAVIEYDGTSSALNFYYLENASLSNDSQTIQLYLLDDGKATLTELLTIDEARNPVEDITIQIQSYDVGTDTFYTVSMAKTSEGGADLVYLNWYDTLYKFTFTQDGSVVKTTSPYKISATPQYFEIVGESPFEFSKFEDMVYNLYYNSTTKNFVYTFVKPSGEVKSSCLRVIKRNITEDTSICLTCETSTSATLYCNIDGYGNGTFIASIYATGSMQWLDTLVQTIGEISSEVYEALGNMDGTIIAIIFSGVVLAFFLISPAVGIVGMILGMLGAMALGFQPIDYASFIGITFVGGIVIWLIQK